MLDATLYIACLDPTDRPVLVVGAAPVGLELLRNGEEHVVRGLIEGAQRRAAIRRQDLRSG